MKKIRTFVMNNTTYTSMAAIAAELGVPRIRPRDFSKYGIMETTDLDNSADDAAEEVAEQTVEAEEVADDVSEVADEVAEAESDTEEDDTDDADDADDAEAEQVDDYDLKGFVESIVDMTIIDFATAIKKFSVDKLLQLIDAVGADGMNKWETIENEPIRKMRLIMELKNNLFPGEKTPVNPPSIWRGIALDKLVELADANGVEYMKVESNENIQRMRVIEALKNTDLTPDDLAADEEADASSEVGEDNGEADE